jgi:hypothetical protein
MVEDYDDSGGKKRHFGSIAVEDLEIVPVLETMKTSAPPPSSPPPQQEATAMIQHAAETTRKEPNMMKIAEYQQVAPILQRLKFKISYGRYYLPPHCWAKDEVDVAYFHSSEELRQNLCQKGVPKTAEEPLDEKDYKALREWVRYAIVVPFLTKANHVPLLDPMDAKEAKAVLKKLGLRIGKRYKCYLGSRCFEYWSDFEHHLTRYGIMELPGLSVASHLGESVVEKNDIIRLTLYLLENETVDLW